jgi:ribosomal protein S27AE
MVDPDALVCPRCGAECADSDEAVRQTCAQCGYAVDIHAQLCYLRGSDGFEAARSGSLPAKKARSRKLSTDQIFDYQQAYSALQEALQGDLAVSQRLAALAMMADMARLFADRLMTSEQEAGYWAKQAVYQNIRQEHQDLQAKLAAPSGAGVAAAVRRWRWRLRCRQLSQHLPRLARQIGVLEEAIGFTYAPRLPRELS